MKAALSHKFSWLFIPLLASLLYARTFRFDYIYYDDVSLIESAKQVSQSKTPIADLFSQGAFGAGAKQDSYYRPLLSLTFYFDSFFDSPIAFRFSNLLFHIAACLLFYLLLVRLSFDKSMALMIALLFTAHPLLAEAVAWIPGRNDSLLALFMVAAILSLFDYLQTSSKIKLFIFSCSFFAALLTKESTLFFIPVLVALTLFFSKSKSQIIILAAIVLVTSAIYFIARNQVMATDVALPYAVLCKLVFKNIPAIPMFMAQAMLPVQLSVLPVFSASMAVVGALFMIILLYLIYRNRFFSKQLMIGATWFFCAGLPALIPNTFSYEMIFLNHRLYLPLMGLLICSAALIQNYWNKSYWQYGALGVLIFFCLLNSKYTEAFKSELDFYTNATTNSPTSSFAWKGFGVCLQAKGDVSGSMSAYRQSLSLNIKIPEVRNNLARLFINQKEYVQSEKLLIEELQIDSTNSMAYYNLATIRIEQNKLPEAVGYLQESVQHSPNNIEALNDLAALLAQQGQYVQALDYCNRILSINPEYEPALRNISMLKELMQNKK
ncbi:MAG: tetratricopeptide repeat protein [Bacteroidetes bacterium]|nr:tetratricopeptide repeat protein [Bacteroidota bacterium]